MATSISQRLCLRDVKTTRTYNGNGIFTIFDRRKMRNICLKKKILFFVVNPHWSCIFEELVLLNVDLAALDSQGAWPWHTVDTSGVFEPDRQVCLSSWHGVTVMIGISLVLQKLKHESGRQTLAYWISI